MMLHPEPHFEPPLLTKAMPTVATWLQAGLRHAGEDLLAEQIDTARVHALCECGENYCFSFYLMPPISLDERRGRWTGLMPRALRASGATGDASRGCSTNSGDPSTR